MGNSEGTVNYFIGLVIIFGFLIGQGFTLAYITGHVEHPVMLVLIVCAEVFAVKKLKEYERID